MAVREGLLDKADITVGSGVQIKMWNYNENEMNEWNELKGWNYIPYTQL